LTPVRAFLFDLDETLTDAQRGIKAAIQAVAEQVFNYLHDRGDHINRNRIISELWKVELERSVRRSYDRDDWWRELIARLDLPPLSPDQLRELTNIYWSTFTQLNQPFPDAEPTLLQLQKRSYALGMITDTDGTPGLKRTRISNLSLLRYFQTIIVAGEDTPKPKPDPQPFLLAAERLGVPPQECVVVGDKPYTDVRGAKASGMIAVRVFRRKWHNEEPAHYTINSLSELLDLLPELSRQG